MTFGELIADLRTLIGRKNLTDPELKRYIEKAMTGLNREVLAPFLIKTAIYQHDAAPLDSITVPSDFVALDTIYTDDRQLIGTDIDQYLSAAYDHGPPRMFVRQGAKVLIRPALPAGQKLTMVYQRLDKDLIDPSDTNGWSQACPAAIVYGAARHAALVYEDERGPTWDAAYQAEVEAVRQQDVVDRWSGPYSMGFESL